MSIDYLNKNGLSYFWSKLKAHFAPKAHTHNAFETKHSYTTATNAAKNWYRIANASTQQLDTSKPIRAQFIITAYNTSYDASYYETWFVNAIVFGRQAHIVIFGNSNAPFSQARILYENTVANIDANDRPAIDLYLNYVLPNGTTKIEVEEIYNNGGWTFVADGQLAASSVPSGFEAVASAPRNNGVNNSTNADYANYLNRQISNITAAFTLADNWQYRSRTLNCTGTFTITIPSISSGYMWCVIKNKNTSSGVITLHPSTTSILIDGSNADITLQPMEYVCIHSAGANNYSLIADGRWKSQKADKATTLEGYGITDAKIVNGTITLGSSSITPLTSVPSHNQASNTITAMTGYSKPSSTSAISTSDTLNQAIGKLEKSIDDADISNVVHRTGVESIAGVKTFIDILHVINNDTGLDSSAIRIHCDALDVASLPSSNKFSNIHFLDVNGIQIGRLLLYKNFDGQTGMAISVKQHNSSSDQDSYDVSLGVRVNSDGSGLAFCPTPPSNNNTNTIATTEWVRSATGNTALNAATATEADYLSPHSLGTDYEMTAADFPNAGYYSVYTFRANTSSAPTGNAGDYKLYAFSENSSFNVFLCTSPRQDSLFFGHFWEGVFRGWHEVSTVDTNQTISGTKTLTDNLKIKNNNITRGTAPSTNQERIIYFYDSANNQTGALSSIYFTDKSSRNAIYAYNTTIATGNNIGYIGIGCDASGNVYTNAPTPASSDNSTQIATTAFVKSQGYITSSDNASGLDSTGLGSDYEMTHTDFANKGIGIWKADFKAGTTSAPRFNDGDFAIMKLYNTTGTTYAQFLCMSPRRDIIYFGKFWNGTWQKWNEVFSSSQNIRLDAGNTIFRSVDTSALWVCGGTHIDSSSSICVTGQSDTNAGRFSCVAKKGSTSSSLVGIYNGNLTWNGQTIQTSSDARLKTSLISVPDDVLDAWSGVDWGQFKFLSAIEEKGDSARQHVGLIAQQVLAAFDARGMDACDYGIACHDVWDDEYYEDTVTGEKTLISKAGETWMIRYTEALCMEAAYQRRENAQLKKRVADLEERLAALELNIA